MNPILTALSSGYSAKQVLKYLSQHNPKLAQQITSALNAGHSLDHVINFISKNEKKLGKLIPEKENRSNNLYKTAQTSIHPSLEGAGKIGLGLATAGAAGYALSRAAPAILGQLRGPLQQATQSSTSQLSNLSPQPSLLTAQQGQPSQGNISTPSPQQNPQQPPNNLSPQIMPQQPVPVQPEGKIINVSEIFTNNQSKEKIDNLLEAGNGPIEVSGYFKKFHPDIAKKIEKESGMSLEKVVEQYNAENKTINQDKVEELIDKPIVKGESVIAPEGLGQVKEIRNGKAIVEIDGKLNKVDVDDLEKPVFSEDDIATKYEELMAMIPEEHRSGFIQWAGYDEDKNTLGFIPRGGKYEELTNITPEEAKLVKEGKGVARTTGQNTEGLWIVGEDTRGGIISQIIHDRRKKNKSKDEQQLSLGLDLPDKEKEDRGMKPLFDEMSYPRNLSREREKRKKLEEKERKKKEKERLKNEAKKRKK